MLIDDDPGLLLARTQRAMRSHLVHMLAENDVTFEQFQTLLGLSEGEDIAQNVLAERLYLEPTYTTRMLRRVEKRGLISRQRDESDARIQRVRVTPGGKVLWDKLTGIREEHLSMVFRCLSRAEQEELERMLNVMYSHITELMRD